MKKTFLTIMLLLASAIPCCASSSTVPQHHWTYHSLQVLAEKKLISADIVPGKTLLTEDQVASLIKTAVKNAKTLVDKIGENELVSLRQLSNAYKGALAKIGCDFAALRKSIEECAAAAGFQTMEPNGGVKETPASKRAATSINKFSFDIYKALAKTKGNMFISPYSISSALSMTYAGARGKTEEEMAKVLGLDSSIHKNMGALVKEINSVPADTAKVSAANALWPSKQEALLPQFTATVRENYKAGLTQLDYKKDPDAAAAVINSWVAKHTENKILDIIAKGTLTRDTMLTLTNAVYFKANWNDKFEPENTRAEAFHTAHGVSVKAPMMTRTGNDINYARTAWGEIAELPYTYSRFSMFVLLPTAGRDFTAAEDALSAEMFNGLASKMSARKVILTIPKFRAEQSFSLSKTLAKMGMPSAFGGGADFSGINGKRNIFIGGVLHKTFISVAEDGTEAAAATAVILSKMSMPAPDPPIIFRADRPFIYVIKDNETGVILFIGRFVKP
ncbi:MAG: serpin family protein [Synergistaceae bacterium]|nr:serpin family protein [Synergistaceae bacterium]